MKEIITDEQIIATFSKKYPEQRFTKFNLFDLIHAVGSPLDALLYAKLFWPDFVEFEEMVFFKNHVEDEGDRDRVRKALTTGKLTKCEVEKQFNLVEIPYLFGSKIGESDDNLDVSLSRFLTLTWESKLKMQFPSRNIIVELDTPEEDVPSITVYQKPH